MTSDVQVWDVIKTGDILFDSQGYPDPKAVTMLATRLRKVHNNNFSANTVRDALKRLKTNGGVALASDGRTAL